MGQVLSAHRPGAVTSGGVPMLFRRLLESNARAQMLITLEGYAVSIAAHAAILAGTFYISQQVQPADPPDAFTPTAYFIPRDRLIGSRPKQERITFMSTESRAGGGVVDVAKKSSAETKPEHDPGPGLTELDSQLSEAQTPTPESTGDSVMTVLEVDSAAARYDESAAPPYPPSMLEKKIEGTVGIQYVVDTTGRADTSSVVILSATHKDFAASVRQTLPLMQFHPAVMNGQKVRQLVQQMFAFRIDTALYSPKKPAHP